MQLAFVYHKQLENQSRLSRPHRDFEVMENVGDWEKMSLLNELIQGRELTKQLQHQLYLAVSSSSSSSHDQTQEMLIHRILASYDKALSMLNTVLPNSGCPHRSSSESPPSLGGSPTSGGDSDRDLNDGSTPGKRKAMQRWTERVRVAPGTELEGPLDDGFSWRKYGQKDILGAKYPRGYYRCTHRNVQGCLATKQVQRSDNDPTFFEITYRGRHTCNHHPATVISPSPLPQNQTDSRFSSDTAPLQIVHPQPQQSQTRSQEIAFGFRGDLTVITPNLDSNNDDLNLSSSMFDFTSTSDNTFGVMSNNSDFFSTPYCLPSSTSATNCFSVSPARLDSFQVDPNFGAPESELAMMVSAATSGNNSQATVRSDSNLPLGSMEFSNENTSFDNTGFSF